MQKAEKTQQTDETTSTLYTHTHAHKRARLRLQVRAAKKCRRQQQQRWRQRQRQLQWQMLTMLSPNVTWNAVVERKLCGTQEAGSMSAEKEQSVELILQMLRELMGEQAAEE